MLDFKVILDPRCVAVDLEAADKDAVLAAMTKLACLSGKVPDELALLNSVREREALSSTGIGEGVAVPHSISDAVGETLLAVATLARPVPFDAVDGQPVRLVFFMAGPQGETGLHLKLLSKLARLLHDPAFRNAAQTAETRESLVSLLHGADSA